MIASGVLSQRIDQWLWHSRIMKSRALAARMVEAGAVRVNREKVLKSGHQIEVGDVLTFMHAGKMHVIEISATASRRGPASEARQLYSDALSSSCEQSTHGDRNGDA